jgi:demethylmenaquinone methyltransferase/2-methoxy-6-polyprenyl-1,4-benzoquinol methylase
VEQPLTTAPPGPERAGDEEKVRRVKEIFATVTGKYDLLNRLLSLRRDVAWRKAAVRRMTFPGGKPLLDVATGTADLALDAARRHPGLRVAGLDFSAEMLEVGREKVAGSGLGDRVALLRGDAMRLPFPDSSFDTVSVAFGVRNMPDRMAALREMARVTAPGGTLLVLEMTAPRLPVFRWVYRVYLTMILPRLASLISGNPAAYVYLGESIMAFPSPEEFAAMMERAGLERVEKHPLTLGVTWLHVARKPSP